MLTEGLFCKKRIGKRGKMEYKSTSLVPKKADMLIAYANAKGGSDNISAILAKF